MKSTLHLACFWVAFASISPSAAQADELDDLLSPDRDEIIADDASAQAAWEDVVDTFRKNDFETAISKGRAFLDGEHTATPYQILGVQTMIALAGGARTSTAGLDPEMDRQIKELETKRDELVEEAKGYQRVIRDANALINRLTQNRTRPVQQGSYNHQQCVMAAQKIEAASAAVKKLEAEHDQVVARINSLGSDSQTNLKGDVIKLLSMLKEAGEIPAAFAITNVYLRKIGPDLDVAKFQQDFVRLQKVHDKAEQVVGLLREKVTPLLKTRHYWAASREQESFVARVREKSTDPDLNDMVRRLIAGDPFDLEAHMAAAEEQAEAIKTLAGIEATTARTRLEKLKSDFPDYPGLALIDMEIAGVSAIDRLEEAEELMDELDRLIEASPDAAVKLLRRLDTSSLSNSDRVKLDVRIETATQRVKKAALTRLEDLMDTALGMLGPETKALVLSTPEGSVRVEDIRSKINPGIDKARVSSILGRITTETAELRKLDLDSISERTVAGLDQQANILRKALEDN